MKPKLIEIVFPFYGMILYFQRYFKADKRGNKEAEIALWMEAFHLIYSMVALGLAYSVLVKYGIL